jgi:hypothetical protein
VNECKELCKVEVSLCPKCMVAGTLTVANRLNVCPFQLSPRRRPITTRPIVLNVDNATSDRASETKNGCKPSTPTSKNGWLKTDVILVFMGWDERRLTSLLARGHTSCLEYM